MSYERAESSAEPTDDRMLGLAISHFNKASTFLPMVASSTTHGMFRPGSGRDYVDLCLLGLEDALPMMP